MEPRVHASAMLAVIDDVTARLTDPRRWVQGRYRAVRDADGSLWSPKSDEPANCWCLTEALTLAVNAHRISDDVASTTLRGAVEAELLATIERGARLDWRPNNLAGWNDHRGTSHADVMALLAATWFRLAEVTRDPLLEQRLDEVTKLAELDARGWLEPRVLTAELADLQDVYDDKYVGALTALQTN